MNETCLWTNMFGEVCEEGNEVVPGLSLDRVDALDVENAVLADRARRRLGDDAERRLRIAGMGLDLEPDPQSLLGRPDPGHRGAAVARDHGRVLARGASGLAINTSCQYRPSSFNAFLSIPYSTKPRAK